MRRYEITLDFKSGGIQSVAGNFDATFGQRSEKAPRPRPTPKIREIFKVRDVQVSRVDVRRAQPRQRFWGYILMINFM